MMSRVMNKVLYLRSHTSCNNALSCFGKYLNNYQAPLCIYAYTCSTNITITIWTFKMDCQIHKWCKLLPYALWQSLSHAVGNGLWGKWCKLLPYALWQSLSHAVGNGLWGNLLLHGGLNLFEVFNINILWNIKITKKMHIKCLLYQQN